ncbi:Uncharacterised protein at_DN1772 [Pycnogonum litorale]
MKSFVFVSTTDVLLGSLRHSVMSSTMSSRPIQNFTMAKCCSLSTIAFYGCLIFTVVLIIKLHNNHLENLEDTYKSREVFEEDDPNPDDFENDEREHQIGAESDIFDGDGIEDEHHEQASDVKDHGDGIEDEHHEQASDVKDHGNDDEEIAMNDGDDTAHDEMTGSERDRDDSKWRKTHSKITAAEK